VGSTEEELAPPVRGCVWASCGELGGGGRGDEIKRHPRSLLAPFLSFFFIRKPFLSLFLMGMEIFEG